MRVVVFAVGGMDLLKRQDGGGLQRLFFGIAKTHAELIRKARRRGPGRDMAKMRIFPRAYP